MLETKICNKCKRTLDKSKFNKCSAKKDGLHTQCRECVNKYRKEYRKKNIDKIRKRCREYNRKNWDKIYEKTKSRETYKQYQREYYQKNKEHLKYKSIQNQKINKAEANARKKKYKETKRKSCPKWLSKNQHNEIKEFYIEAKKLEQIDGIKRHVDHIIPLQGKNVSGLHVPWNLQILTQTENLEKSNKYEY